MAVNIFWPPLTALVFFVIIIAFLVLKYGDRFLKARTTPRPQQYEIEDRSSENTTFIYDEKRSLHEMERFSEKGSIDEMVPYPMQTKPDTQIMEKYEYAV